jgi:alanyl-tRNA synthetase
MYYSTNTLRIMFTEYFQNKSFKNLTSFSLIPTNDPSLLFVNAGMTPLKYDFINSKDSIYSHVTTIQKCLRVGGKHNDLAHVGFTKRHHTFFEMCGCFSFDGKISKRQIMTWSYDFLVNHLNLPAEHLKFSYLTGDNETLRLWADITGLPNQHFFADSDNTWSMGEVGPFGACTEIYYQTTEELLEIWNIVFMTHHRTSAGQVEALPNLCIDTGMGLERLAAVCQGVDSTFDSDLLSLLQSRIKELLQCDDQLTLRILSDHMRALVMLAADNLIPGPDGRGYVMRRIARRALIFAVRYGVKGPVLAKLVPATIEIMSTGYPNLDKQMEMIQNLLEVEEDKFLHVLHSTKKILRSEIEKCNAIMDGATIFKLYTTYGIPLEMIDDTCTSYGITLDMPAYEDLLSQSKLQHESFNKLQNIDVVKTEFNGYDNKSCTGRVIGLYATKTYTPVNSLTSEGLVVLDKTVLYGQSGGQQGDRGWIVTKEGAFKVVNTIYKEKCILHIGHMVSGKLREGDQIESSYDVDLRELLKRHHTATHLLHSALIELYGAQVLQKGSSVQEDKLRFDFTDPHATLDVGAIEDLVNKYIFNNYLCIIEQLTPDEAISRGVLMLEGFNYGTTLRTLTVGDNISAEACGGTHVNSTGEIGIFKITNMYKINNGIRRIDAVCSLRALDMFKEYENILKQCSALGGCSPDKLVNQISNYKDICKQSLKTIEQLQECLYEEQSDKNVFKIGEMTIKFFKIPGDTLLRKKISGVKVPLCLINIESHISTMHFTNAPAAILDQIDILKNSLIAQGGGKQNKLVLTSSTTSIEKIVAVLKDLLQ